MAEMEDDGYEDEKDVLPYELPPEVAEIDELWKGSDYMWEEDSLEKLNLEVDFLSDAQAQLETHTSKGEENDRPGPPFNASTTDEQESDRLRISWTQPDNLPKEEEYSYQVRYKEKGGKWQRYETGSSEPIATVINLRANTTYIFKVRVIYEDDEGPFGPESGEIKTVASPAMSIKKKCNPLQGSEDSPLKYPLPLQRVDNVGPDSSPIRNFVLGEENAQQMEKTILLVGATGSGKSTLVDGMVNYILGVNWEDEFRFHVVELEESELQMSRNETMSQTEFISCYTINPPIGSRFNYRLKIIDTPGFGDTRGIERDEELVTQIRQLFTGNGNGIHFLDGICFLAKAPDARLTQTQRYIFEQILSLFGKDVESYICPLITFADGREPQVLSALKEYVPFKFYFTFNNSALFAKNKRPEEGDLSKFFWEMGKKSYQAFFSVLQTLVSKSLSQTKEVLLTRHKLQITISELQREVKVGIQKVGELEAEIEIFREKEEEFMKSKSFKYTVMETIPFKETIKDGQNTTNCNFCKKTCHYPCTETTESNKSKCTAMDWKGNCLQCKRHCNSAVHKSDNFIYSFVQVPVVRSRADMEKRYKKAGEEIISHGEILASMHKELSEREESIRTKIETITMLNNRLREIALKPTQVSLLDYIDLLIAQEKKSGAPGMMNRLKILNDIREKAQVGKTTEVFDKMLKSARKQAAGTVQMLTTMKK